MNELKCPNCNGTNLVNKKAMISKNSSICFIIGILTCWIFGIGVIFIILSIIAFFVSAKTADNVYICKTCQKEFKWINTQDIKTRA
jgi:DNA-directed RNA polymerase subunit RPC12/RpoP